MVHHLMLADKLQLISIILIARLIVLVEALRWGQQISRPSTASCGAHEGHILPADITDKRRTEDIDLLKCYDV